MKRKNVFVLLIGLFALTLSGIATVNACGEGEGHGGAGQIGMSTINQTLMSFAKDAKIEVKYTSNGAVISITSNKPEVVKAIQARAANFGTSEESRGANATLIRSASFIDNDPGGHGCSDKCKGKGSEECKEAHASGKCTGHQPGEGH